MRVLWFRYIVDYECCFYIILHLIDTIILSVYRISFRGVTT